MHLAGYELLQSRDALVYHMTCRGSRFKDGLQIEAEIPLPDGTIWYKPRDSEEYKALRTIKFREWWRKWGCNVLHDDNLLPIVPPKYDIGFYVANCMQAMLNALEPWCSTLYTDYEWHDYITQEQPNTKFDLSKRVVSCLNRPTNDIVVYFDASKLTAESMQIIQQLSQIIADSGAPGTFNLDIFQITINRMVEHQHELIKCNTTSSSPATVKEIL